MYRSPSRLFVCGTEIASTEGTTQGDNLAMSLFALGTIPILRRLQLINNVSQVWLADDATAVGDLQSLYKWWTNIISEGRKYGYYVNQTKSCLILKDSNQQSRARQIFQDKDITIELDGHRHLGAVLGTAEFRDSYIKNLVNEWCGIMNNLVEFAKSQPHAAYSAFTHGVRHKFTYFMRTIEEMSEHLAPVDDIITNKFIPVLFGCPISPLEREIMALPLKYGGLGIPVLADLAIKEYSTSVIVTQHLVEIMKLQRSDKLADESLLREELQKVLKDRVEEYQNRYSSLIDKCDKNTTRLLEQASETCSSNWLSCLHIKKHGFTLNKSEFKDSLCLRYGKDLARLPSECPCGEEYSINHALNCHRGGFIIIRHNEIRDFEANMLKLVCNDVKVEPELQPLDNEQLRSATLTGEQARPDIRARGFWRPAQAAFFDVKVINPNADSYLNIPTKKVYERAENAKKSSYNDRIINVEHGTFSPLIFSINGGMGPQAMRFSKLLCDKISYKKRQKYNDIVNFYRCKLSFLIKRLALLCIRGSRSVYTKNNVEIDDDFEFNCFQAKLS